MSNFIITINHDEIKQWATQNKGIPELIEDPEAKADHVGIRIDFPGDTDDIVPESKYREASWEEFFNVFEKQGLALQYKTEFDTEDPSSNYMFIKRSELA